MQTFDQLVTKVEEGWWNQAKAKVAGMGSSIAGDQAGAAKKQAQSLAMSSPAFALFDQFKQDMLELTKSTDQLQFNKKFPEQAKFITNIEANLAVLKAGNVGDPAAAEQQPDVATTKGAASAAARAKRDQVNKQNQDAARAAATPTAAAAPAPGAAPSVPVTTSSVHVNDVDMINEAYYGMQEAPLGKAKWAARRAKMGNLMKTVTGRGGEVVDATMAAVNSRMETFKKKFQDTLGKLQTDLTAVGLGAESPALQAITNTLGSAEQIPPTTPDEIAAAAPEEEPTDADAAADDEVAAQQQAADDEAGARDAAAQAGADDDAAAADAVAQQQAADDEAGARDAAAQAGADDDAAAADAAAQQQAADAERQRQADAEAEYYADQPEEPEVPVTPEVPKKRELSQTPRNIARRAKTADNRAAKVKKRGQMDRKNKSARDKRAATKAAAVKKRAQMDQKNTRARDKRAGRAMDPKNIKRREKRRGTWRGESAMRGTRRFNEFVSRYL